LALIHFKDRSSELNVVLTTLETLIAAVDEDPSRGSISMVIHNLAAYLELRLSEAPEDS
jgi:hypothetical protein